MRYTVSLLVDGLVVRKVNHQGKTYLPISEAGKEFVIRVENNSSERVAAVVSVDGLSVMDGKTASHDSSGYVIAANSYVDIDGWRRGNEEVAAFVVKGAGEEGYSEQMGKGRANVGVIGCVIIPEKRRIRTHLRREPVLGFSDDCFPSEQPTIMRCVSKATSHIPSPPSIGLYESRQDASTGYGNRIQSAAKSIPFDRDESRKQVITLYYDLFEALKAKGVPVEVGPNPFPAEPERFHCPEPPGWEG